jgi:Bromodomain
VFSSPVVEAYPEIADSYLEVVEEPMDFRTIEEERLPAYNSIRDLQDDLILTFRNCMTFNRRGTEFWILAQ